MPPRKAAPRKEYRKQHNPQKNEINKHTIYTYMQDKGCVVEFSHPLTPMARGAQINKTIPAFSKNFFLFKDIVFL